MNFKFFAICIAPSDSDFGAKIQIFFGEINVARFARNIVKRDFLK